MAYDFFLTLDNLRNIIYDSSPLIFKSHKDWFNTGYDICTKMIREQNNSILSTIFALYYYISGFEEEHFFIRISDDVFSTYHKILYPKFSVSLNSDGSALYVTSSINSNVPSGSTIKKINNKPFNNYIKEFMCFDSGLYSVLNERILSSRKIFLDRGNPYIKRPNVIELDNGKKILLKYFPVPNNSITTAHAIRNNRCKVFEYYRDNKTLFITIPEFNGINFIPIRKLFPINNIVLDIRDNPGGLLSDIENFYSDLFNLKISTTVIFKESPFLRSNIMKKNKLLTTCQTCIAPPNKKKVNYPSLTIIYNSNTRSICRFLIKIAKLYINNLKLVGGDFNTDKICGNIMNIETDSYNLIIPTVCCCFKTEEKLLN